MFTKERKINHHALSHVVDGFEEFLKKIGTPEMNYILVNPNHFMRIKYTGELKSFLEKVEPYYHCSKKSYVTRPDMTYTQFITVMRQIAGANGVRFESKMKHSNSMQFMEYYFFVD
jgi:hypothetical protein